MGHKFVFELGWRAYFRHVWQHRAATAFCNRCTKVRCPTPAYARELPADIRAATTGVPVVDMAVRELYATGMLHNHARMWLASYVVHVRKVHWRCGADWLYGHLLDGDLASNHLSWQWVAGTGSSKPYLFNADNVARYASAPWHSPGQRARHVLRGTRPHGAPACAAAPGPNRASCLVCASLAEPRLLADPPDALGLTAPDAAVVAGRDVWLVHPWEPRRTAGILTRRHTSHRHLLGRLPPRLAV